MDPRVTTVSGPAHRGRAAGVVANILTDYGKSRKMKWIITGGAGSEVAGCAAAGIDTFITGEGPHWSYPLAEELGLNVLYAGHYATETFGVKAAAGRLARDFGLATAFIDRPTGL